jgi:hypothetical protein
MQHHRQKDADNLASDLAGQIAVSGRLLVATVVGACSSDPRGWGLIAKKLPQSGGGVNGSVRDGLWAQKQQETSHFQGPQINFPRDNKHTCPPQPPHPPTPAYLSQPILATQAAAIPDTVWLAYICLSRFGSASGSVALLMQATSAVTGTSGSSGVLILAAMSSRNLPLLHNAATNTAQVARRVSGEADRHSSMVAEWSVPPSYHFCSACS